MRGVRRRRRRAEPARPTPQPSPLDFAFERFECVEVGGGQALARLAGTWRGDDVPDAPSLEARAAGRSYVYRPLPAAPAERDAGDGPVTWQAGYALPMDLVGESTRFALRVQGRSIALPAPQVKTLPGVGREESDAAEAEPVEALEPVTAEAADEGDEVIVDAVVVEDAVAPALDSIQTWWIEDAERRLADLNRLRTQLEEERSAREGLDAESAEWQKTWATLDAKIFDLEERIGEAKAAARNRESELAAAARELQQVSTEFKEARAELQRAELAAKERASDATLLRRRALDAAAEVERREEARAALEAELTKRREAHRDELSQVRVAHKHQLDAERAKVERAESEKALLQSELAAARAEAEGRDSARDDVERQLEKARQEIKRAEIAQAELERWLTETRAELGRRDAQRAEEAERLAEAEAALERDAAEREGLETRLAAARAELELQLVEVRSELDATAGERAALEAKVGDVDAVGAERAVIQGELDAARAALAEAESERDRLAEAHADLSSELDAGRLNLERLTEELETERAARADLYSEATRLRHERAAFDAAIEEQRERADEAAARAEERAAELTLVRREAEDARSAAEAAQTALEQATETAGAEHEALRAELESQLDVLRAEAQRHEGERDELVAAAIEEAVERETNRVHELERRLDQSYVDEERLRAEVVEAGAVIQTLEEDVRGLQREGQEARDHAVALEAQLAQAREALRRGVRERLFGTGLLEAETEAAAGAERPEEPRQIESTLSNTRPPTGEKGG
jgi:chromosome segregation ATPase